MSGSARFAYDSYRRFVQMFAKIVLDVDGERFEDALARAVERAGVDSDAELSAETLRDLLGVRGDVRAWTLRDAMRRIAAEPCGALVILRDNESPRALADAVQGLTQRDAGAAELDLGAESLATADTFDGELGELDLSLDLDDLGAAEGPDVEHGGDELPEFDLPLGELELDASATATADAALDADLALLDGSDETTTKLDLARAYLDMGDLDGARDILEEVAQEGNATQREEAATLLARVRGNH